MRNIKKEIVENTYVSSGYDKDYAEQRTFSHIIYTVYNTSFGSKREAILYRKIKEKDIRTVKKEELTKLKRKIVKMEKSINLLNDLLLKKEELYRLSKMG